MTMLSCCVLLAGIMAAGCSAIRDMDSPHPTSTAASTEAGGNEEQERTAEAIARELVARIQASAAGGDLQAAAEMWSGYPYRVDEKLTRMEAFVDDNPWLVDTRARYDVVDAWSFDPSSAMSVVAVTDLDRRGTAAILIDRAGTIQRMQTNGDFDRPISVDGDRVVVHTQPIEGGVVAYLSEAAIDAGSVSVDQKAGSVVITLPESGPFDDVAVLIVSMATPELPTASSYLVVR